MPELPEVETVARGLDKNIAGDVIESVWLGEKPEPLKSSPAEIAAVLEHSRIARVRRVGKHIVFDLERSGTHVSKTTGHGAPLRAEREPRFASKGRTRTLRQAQGRLRSTGTGSSRGQWIVHLGMT